ncbi:hypothetical protein [Paraburkholderia antibiotica]|uniref:Uncharacterized protein n=1 Tax=Paraburkholderia antibiotica TaxID=2728839 RepID=A0A7X9X2A4_9BURK|nr:hypothetical protein [Paraburkholderia antibiotica]NML30107.1 hypothetical protein [Paraburkholderia antibiotica]
MADAWLPAFVDALINASVDALIKIPRQRAYSCNRYANAARKAPRRAAKSAQSLVNQRVSAAKKLPASLSRENRATLRSIK